MSDTESRGNKWSIKPLMCPMCDVKLVNSSTSCPRCGHDDLISDYGIRRAMSSESDRIAWVADDCRAFVDRLIPLSRDVVMDKLRDVERDLVPSLEPYRQSNASQYRTYRDQVAGAVSTMLVIIGSAWKSVNEYHEDLKLLIESNNCVADDINFTSGREQAWGWLRTCHEMKAKEHILSQACDRVSTIVNWSAPKLPSWVENPSASNHGDMKSSNEDSTELGHVDNTMNEILETISYNVLADNSTLPSLPTPPQSVEMSSASYHDYAMSTRGADAIKSEDVNSSNGEYCDTTAESVSAENTSRDGVEGKLVDDSRTCQNDDSVISHSSIVSPPPSEIPSSFGCHDDETVPSSSSNHGDETLRHEEPNVEKTDCEKTAQIISEESKATGGSTDEASSYEDAIETPGYEMITTDIITVDIESNEPVVVESKPSRDEDTMLPQPSGDLSPTGDEKQTHDDAILPKNKDSLSHSSNNDEDDDDEDDDDDDDYYEGDYDAFCYSDDGDVLGDYFKNPVEDKDSVLPAAAADQPESSSVLSESFAQMKLAPSDVNDPYDDFASRMQADRNPGGQSADDDDSSRLCLLVELIAELKDGIARRTANESRRPLQRAVAQQDWDCSSRRYDDSVAETNEENFVTMISRVLQLLQDGV